MNHDLENIINVTKKKEIWNIPDVVADEEDESSYKEFIKIRDIIEEKARAFLIRISN